MLEVVAKSFSILPNLSSYKVEQACRRSLSNRNKKATEENSNGFCDPEGTRTLDLLRDRQAF